MLAPWGGSWHASLWSPSPCAHTLCGRNHALHRSGVRCSCLLTYLLTYILTYLHSLCAALLRCLLLDVGTDASPVPHRTIATTTNNHHPAQVPLALLDVGSEDTGYNVRCLMTVGLTLSGLSVLAAAEMYGLKLAKVPPTTPNTIHLASASASPLAIPHTQHSTPQAEP